MHDLLCLVEHLHLLLGVTVVLKDVDLWNYVVSQLVSELVYCWLFVIGKLLILLLKLSHSCCTGT